MTIKTKILSCFYILLITLFCHFFITPHVFAATYPSGFSESAFVTGLNAPTAMEFAPDGRLFVSEKAGTLRVVKNGTLQSTPFLTLSVNSQSERGLLGIAFDPNFSTNRFIYIYYTRSISPIKNRVSRFRADASNPDISESSNETILLDDIPSDAGIHNGGAIHFGNDGKLYIAVGDGGSNHQSSQDSNSLSGKILRINKDGSIPSDNPFVGQANKRAEVWAMGLRNPFTFAFKPGTSIMFINDVGENTWEEINHGIKGANYGWPTCEGTCDIPGFTNPIYQQYHPLAQAYTGGAFYTGTQFPSSYQGVYFFGDYSKSYIKTLDPSNGNVVSDFGSNTTSPVDIRVGSDGALYYLSINNGTVYKILYGSITPTPTLGNGNGLFGTYYNNTDFTGNSTSRTDQTINFDWGQGSPDPAIEPDTFSARWVGQAQPQFSETYTFYTRTDDGVRLWVNDQLIIDDWNDQSATEKTGSIALVSGQKYNIKMEYYESYADAVAQLSWSSPSTPKQIIPQSQLYASNNQPPQALISSPQDQSLYAAGDIIRYSGTGTDTEDGTIPDSGFSWTVVFHHDTHTHPFLGPITGLKQGSFQIPKTGESSANVWYRIHLTVTDSKGATHSVYTDVVPKKSIITVTSNPSGLQVTLDGQPKTAPYQTESVIGFTRALGADTSQTFNGKTYDFVSWSDGGAQTHSFDTPGSNTTYTATYQERAQTGGDGLLGTYFDNIDFTNQKLQRVDSTVNFDWNQDPPDSSIYQETFSVRWTGSVMAQYSQPYTFYTRTDDGVKLWVNNQLIIDNAVDQSVTEKTGTIQLEAGKKYTIKMEYYDNYIFAVAQLSWSSPSTPKQIIPQSQLFSNSSGTNGLHATYFTNKNFSGTSITRTDATIDFDWGQGSPDPSIDSDTFSARWTGQIQPQFSETYTFYTTSDDGVRLWINNQLIIDNWNDQSVTEKSGTITLQAGQRYTILVEYYDNYVFAVMKLLWSSPSTPKEVVPTGSLFTL